MKTHTHTRTRTHICVRARACIRVFTRVCLCVCVRVCARVCGCACVCLFLDAFSSSVGEVDVQRIVNDFRETAHSVIAYVQELVFQPIRIKFYTASNVC